MCFFFFKQKPAYEMRISDWSSVVCSSDLLIEILRQAHRPRDLDPSVMARAAERSEVATAEMANLARLRVPPLNASKLCAKATDPGVKLAAEPVEAVIEVRRFHAVTVDEDKMVEREDHRPSDRKHTSRLNSRQ